jgi:hypothetical protein
LEQAKLGKAKPAVLEGRAVYITGGASGIGLACAHTFGTFTYNTSIDFSKGRVAQMCLS